MKKDGQKKNALVAAVQMVVGILAVLWVVELVDMFLLSSSLDQFGIRPRSVDGLVGIATAPFLHGGIGHLVSNTVGFAVLGTVLAVWSRAELLKVSLASALVGGAGTWLVGASNSVHIGASGVVFGVFGYLLLRGLFERKVKSIVISVLVAWVYGSMAFGMVPLVNDAHISWEGHLFGFLGGALCAYAMRKPAEQRAVKARA